MNPIVSLNVAAKIAKKQNETASVTALFKQGHSLNCTVSNNLDNVYKGLENNSFGGIDKLLRLDLTTDELDKEVVKKISNLDLGSHLNLIELKNIDQWCKRNKLNFRKKKNGETLCLKINIKFDKIINPTNSPVRMLMDIINSIKTHMVQAYGLHVEDIIFYKISKFIYGIAIKFFEVDVTSKAKEPMPLFAELGDINIEPVINTAISIYDLNQGV